jgi:hypothetical protein
MEKLTKLTTLFDEDSQELMTGESCLLYSHDDLPVIRQSEADELMKLFAKLKLNRYFDCIEKAKRVAKYFDIKNIHLGSLFLDSTEPGVSYGYLYNPPLELHAWVQVYGIIIDFALAGTIEKGLKTKDEVGPFLVGRPISILAGTPAPWMHYQTYEIVSVENVNQLDIETAKELLKKTITWK